MTTIEKRTKAAAKKREARLKKLSVLHKQRDKLEADLNKLHHKQSIAVSKMRARLGAIRVKIAAV